MFNQSQFIKMPILNISSRYRLAIPIVLALMVFVSVDLWNVKVWQQALLKTKSINKAHVEVRNKIEIKNGLLNERLNKKPLSFVQFDLPALPIELTSNSLKDPDFKDKKLNDEGLKTNALRENTLKKIDVNKNKISIVNLNDKKGTQNKAVNNQLINKSQIKNRTKNKRTSAIYQQLVSDQTINIEIAWPDNKRARQNVFDFLYQCAGMKFGVLNNQEVTLAKNEYLTFNKNNNQQPSEWLRIAQGELNNQELKWLQQYKLSGTAVRLFPKAIDWQLATLLTNQLNGASLKSLRAIYQLSGYRLMLASITLNGKLLANDWTLIQSKCPK